MLKKFIPLFALAFATTLWLGSCTAQSSENVLAPDAYEAAIAKADNAQIVDVRTPKEYNAGHLKNATNINVLANTFKTEIAKLDKNNTYYIYCRSGKRSARAAGIMKNLGFTSVYDLRGGFLAWSRANKKIVQ